MRCGWRSGQTGLPPGGELVAGVRRHVGSGVCRVAAYEARRTEPPTDLLVDRLTALGYDVVVPVTQPDRDLDWCVAGAPDAAGAVGLWVGSNGPIFMVRGSYGRCIRQGLDALSTPYPPT